MISFEERIISKVARLFANNVGSIVVFLILSEIFTYLYVVIYLFVICCLIDDEVDRWVG